MNTNNKPPGKPLNQQQKPSVASLIDKLNQLPMLPTVVSRMMTLNPAAEEFQGEVLKLLEEDPTFAARLIQLANSAFSHPTVPIVTLKDALIRMGSVNVHNLITSLAVIKVFMPSNQGQKNLWIHAIQVAVAARTFSIISPYNVILPEEAYLCGLMHDIGRFIMFSESPEELARVDATNWSNPKQLVEAERKVCGYDHVEMGWHACLSWKLPELVTNVVKYHHHYLFKKSNTARLVNIGRVIRIIQMADFFSTLIMFTENFDLLSEAELNKLITDRCVVSSWPEMPVSIEMLVQLAKPIYFEAEVLITNLGLHS